MKKNSFEVSESAPYPAIQVSQTDVHYADAMLSNIGSCSSEMSAVSQYFYNCIITKDMSSEVSEYFLKIAIVEMHHLEIFGSLAYLLGGDPRLWSMSNDCPVYWSPGCNQYSAQLPVLIKNAVQHEKEAISAYRQQACWIKDPYVKENLNRIILDEELHIRIFHYLYQTYCGR